MYVQLYNFLILEASKRVPEKLPRTWYFLLDEFGNMRKIAKFENWVTISRSRNIFFVPMVQSKAQLDAVYGENGRKMIIQNCQTQMFLKGNDIDDAKYFVELIGSYTVHQRSTTINSQVIKDDGVSDNVSLAKMDLLSLNDVQQMPKESGLLYADKVKTKIKLVPAWNKRMISLGVFPKGTLDTNPPLIDLEATSLFYNIGLRNNMTTTRGELIKKAAKPDGNVKVQTPSDIEKIKSDNHNFLDDSKDKVIDLTDALENPYLEYDQYEMEELDLDDTLKKINSRKNKALWEAKDKEKKKIHSVEF
jgi:hypothetical protein